MDMLVQNGMWKFPFFQLFLESMPEQRNWRKIYCCLRKSERNTLVFSSHRPVLRFGMADNNMSDLKILSNKQVNKPW